MRSFLVRPGRSGLLLAVPLLLFAPSRLCVSASAHDWFNWRGPEQTGVSREMGLPEKWSPDPNAANNNLVWTSPVGSRSTPTVMNGKVYLITGTGQGLTEQERVVCLNADTGKVEWEHKFNVFLTDIVSDRVGWTNLAGDPDTGNVYAHGVQGLVFCFSKDGKVLWSRSLTEEYGRISGYGGRVTTPVVDGNLVIIGMLNASWGDQARGGNRFVAFDKKAGEVVWWASTGIRPKDTYYSTPTVSVVGGQRLLISGGGDGGVHAFKVRTGEKVWSYLFGSGAVNCSPVVDGNLVYIAHGDENPDSNKQGRVICVDGSKVKDGQPELVWKVDGIKVKFASPIIHEGRLYVADEVARLYCLDAKTGKQVWRFGYGRNSMGSPVLADGKIYVGEVQSKFHILKPGPTKCERLHSHLFQGPAGSTADVELNGSPAVANGRVYFCTSNATYCIGKKDHPAAADQIQGKPEVAPPANVKAAHLQVFPADVVLSPGQGTSFKAFAFDDQGRLLREVKAEWSLAPSPPPEGVTPTPPPPGTTPPRPVAVQGEVTPEGKLTVAKAPPGQFGLVMAKAEGLTGKARVRVAPGLPYVLKLDNIPVGRFPGGWVNTQGKFEAREKDGAKVLVKTATVASPLVARANAFIGVPTLSNYTIQADVMGQKKAEYMPDVGIVNCRYSLVLDGNKQQLRLISWDALPRVDKSISWPWKPDTWYTLKLTVEPKGDKAVIRGKIWPRGDAEPKEWTVEFEDPVPNREGSPGLYGYGTGILDNEPGTEIYYDKVSVTPNAK